MEFCRPKLPADERRRVPYFGTNRQTAGDEKSFAMVLRRKIRSPCLAERYRQVFRLTPIPSQKNLRFPLRLLREDHLVIYEWRPVEYEKAFVWRGFKRCIEIQVEYVAERIHGRHERALKFRSIIR